ncbi:hypothetical protein A7K91_14305 [Paenibacillus oryzae]|uniref:Uncharacterized protein n=1 Tax=Paenibacillus oryzae TaxID=1844972 RepID=A0A1A5YK15_9BACL|nr:hypothetical protein [Paenibacillus oryzae]OBR65730.1 hypothetical protein A7K91_14305 [Paenibacillus oryzae]
MNMRISNKKIKAMIILLAAGVLLAFLFPLVRGNTKEQYNSIAQTEISRPEPRAVRGQTYNEILVVYRYFNHIRAGVYNDIGKTLISEEAFAAIDTEAVKKQFGAMAVLKNGPRFWVMDEITGYYNGTEKTIAGYSMNQPGILNLSLSDLNNRTPYGLHQVIRKTTYTFKKGEKVYELVSDQNEVYTMQSASREVDQTLSLTDLDDLGSRLDLPDGWIYRVRVLEEDVTYHIDGIADVIQDEFQNSYQKNPSDKKLGGRT